MRYASVCSGVEAASLAWMPLGWDAGFFSEIEPFPCAVLEQRFPDIPNLGDMMKIEGKKYRGTVDLLVGGTPCQGFSAAGKRGGLDDPRSALALVYAGLLETMRPRWFVWENVPGVFSIGGGRDFREFIAAITQIGYGVCWRVLDAQYVRVDGFPRAVPQRRRRVFAVGYLGDWRPAAEVLFEPSSLLGDTPPHRKAGAGAARSLTASTGGASGKEQQHTFIGAAGEPLNAIETGTGWWRESEVAATVLTNPLRDKTICMSSGQGGAEINANVSPALTCDHEAPISFRWAASPSQGLPIGVGYCHTLMTSRSGEPAVCQYGAIAGTLTERHDSSPCADRGMNIVACYENHGQDSRVKEIDCAPVISAKAGTGGNNLPLVASATVRRLTPRECERLTGFPDDWTRIAWRGKPPEQCPDSLRYKACGNSMCVNVMRWIGMRIEMVKKRRI